ncbi:DUF1080 domain-containing protein [Seonamhaeicola sp. ML3]|uniref:3-keto-disaccharide hydrolase n=1 Tax=Seonamhaeicola sp. ML3 TaxID=2937786 RepID=UPI0020106BB9|nr:DUF1080 domain-containing protein [Seonamhaeicola sp. ML3]
MKRLLFILSLSLLFNSCKSDNEPVNPNQETWINLFNGKDLSGWDIKISGHELNDNYKETFIVQDSMIRVNYDNYDTFDDKFGHLYYKTPYSYYKISFDYRFIGEQTPGGAHWNVRNSGIMLHSQSAESVEIGQTFPISVELQLLGGLNDGKRQTANVCTPGTAVMFKDTINFEHCIRSNSKTFNGDQWVHVDATIMGGEHMEFLVNGTSVLKFDKPQINGGFSFEWEKGKDWDRNKIIRDKQSWIAKKGTILTEGYIALQAESSPIDFKNIKLLDLCGCMDPKAKNYKSYYVKDEPESCKY